ncbi:MAG: hypothetical protein J5766_03735 [Clostridia bacterium]|nr:hypothetical protein [Clostridia bacterium]
MFCYNCGKEIGISNFCPFCGVRINPAPNMAGAPVKQEENKPVDDKFSMNITDTIIVSGKGLVLVGVIEKGKVFVNQQVSITDIDGKAFVILAMNKGNERIEVANPGESVSILISGAEGIDKDSVKGKVLQPFEQKIENKETVNYDEVFSDIAGPVSNVNYSEVIQQPTVDQTDKTSGADQNNAYPNQNSVNPDLNNTYPNQNTVYPNQNNVTPGQINADPYSGNSMQGFNLTATVGLRTGKGLSFLSMTNTGKMTVTPAGVTYSIVMGVNKHTHSYAFSEVASTKFSMTHAGLQPLFGYTVTLKDGRSFIYYYSPFQKSKMQSIDATIHQNMT